MGLWARSPTNPRHVRRGHAPPGQGRPLPSCTRAPRPRKRPRPTGRGRAEVAAACPPAGIPWHSIGLALFEASGRSPQATPWGAKGLFAWTRWEPKAGCTHALLSANERHGFGLQTPPRPRPPRGGLWRRRFGRKTWVQKYKSAQGNIRASQRLSSQRNLDDEPEFLLPRPIQLRTTPNA